MKVLDMRWAALCLATVGGAMALAVPASAQATSAGAPGQTASLIGRPVVAVTTSSTSDSAVAAWAEHRHHRHYWHGGFGHPGTGCFFPGAYRSAGSYGTEGVYGPYGVHDSHGYYNSCGPNYGGYGFGEGYGGHRG